MIQRLNTRRGGFTLVEIMIVVAIIALLAAIAVPNFLRARKRSQATRCLEDLRIIDSAQDQYAIENNKTSGNAANWTDLQAYLKNGSVIYNSAGTDLLGNQYNDCTIHLGFWTTARQEKSAMCQEAFLGQVDEQPSLNHEVRLAVVGRDREALPGRSITSIQ